MNSKASQPDLIFYRYSVNEFDECQVNVIAAIYRAQDEPIDQCLTSNSLASDLMNAFDVHGASINPNDYNLSAIQHSEQWFNLSDHIVEPDDVSTDRGRDAIITLKRKEEGLYEPVREMSFFTGWFLDEEIVGLDEYSATIPASSDLGQFLAGRPALLVHVTVDDEACQRIDDVCTMDGHRGSVPHPIPHSVKAVIENAVDEVVSDNLSHSSSEKSASLVFRITDDETHNLNLCADVSTGFIHEFNTQTTTGDLANNAVLRFLNDGSIELIERPDAVDALTPNAQTSYDMSM